MDNFTDTSLDKKPVGTKKHSGNKKNGNVKFPAIDEVPEGDSTDLEQTEARDAQLDKATHFQKADDVPNSMVSPPDISSNGVCGCSEEEDDFEEGDDDGDDDKLSGDDKLQIHTGIPKLLEDVILNPDLLSGVSVDARTPPAPNLKDHMVMCLFANGSSPLLCLQNFLKPLRSKLIPLEDIKPVVIICLKSYIEKEWPIICSIPKVYVVLGSPLRWKNLKIAQVTKSSVCVVLTGFSTSTGHEPAIDDKEAILCTLSIQKKMRKLKKKLPVITDLRHESNVQFLDFGDDDRPEERIYKSEPYACGRAFSVSMFDSVTSSAFHGPGLLNLLEGLVNLSSTCRIGKVPICGTGFAGEAYSKFYNSQLEEYGVCLGIARQYPANRNQNFIITCPGKDLVLEETDIAFVLTG